MKLRELSVSVVKLVCAVLAVSYKEITMTTREAVIVSAVRTPVGKAKRGSLATVRPDDLAATVIKELLKRTPNLDPAEIEDVVIGCAFPEGEQGMNMARMVALRAGLPISVPGETINRYCSSGVQCIAHAAYAIMAGDIDIAIAGGTELMTMVPMAGYKFSPNPYFAQDLPQYYTNMGLPPRMYRPNTTSAAKTRTSLRWPPTRKPQKR